MLAKLVKVTALSQVPVLPRVRRELLQAFFMLANHFIRHVIANFLLFLVVTH